MGGAKAPTTYDLIAPRSFAGATKPAQWQLVVNEPTAVRALDTDRIMVRPSPDKVSYYRGVAWSDRLPRLMQARMIETFQNSGAVRAVGGPGDRVDGDFNLATEIRAFQIDAHGAQAAAQIDIFAKLVDNRSAKIVASRGFSARVPASKDDPASGVSALNQALTEVLQDTSQWVSSQRR
jgi:cholesterol transport system auxiliary component